MLDPEGDNSFFIYGFALHEEGKRHVIVYPAFHSEPLTSARPIDFPDEDGDLCRSVTTVVVYAKSLSEPPLTIVLRKLLSHFPAVGEVVVYLKYTSIVWANVSNRESDKCI
jgi:hypothetical protein